MEKLVGSPYGNYVVQKALAVTEHELVPELACLVRPYVGRLGGRAASRKLRKMVEHRGDDVTEPVSPIPMVLEDLGMTTAEAAASEHGSRLLQQVN